MTELFSDSRKICKHNLLCANSKEDLFLNLNKEDEFTASFSLINFICIFSHSFSLLKTFQPVVTVPAHFKNAQKYATKRLLDKRDLPMLS